MTPKTPPTPDASVECSHCGKGGGTKTDNGRFRCHCGRFASEAPDYCAKHDVDYSRITGYDHCPRCRQEQELHHRRMEQIERRADPSMHNQIDGKI